MEHTQPSDLWSVSEFERARAQSHSSSFGSFDGPTVLPTTLLADLRRLESIGDSDDVLQVTAACMRQREAALLCFDLQGRVWPVTMFPLQMVYHSPRSLADAGPQVLSRLKLLRIEPPGVRPPGDAMQERVADHDRYRPLAPLLWAMALQGPRASLLTEIAGSMAYRAVKNLDGEGAVLGGAMRSAAERLRRETVSLRAVCEWPGMSVERASRLLNGLYLSSSLLATRAHPAAREGKGSGLLGMLRWPKSAR